MPALTPGHLAALILVGTLSAFPARAQQFFTESAALPEAHRIELDAWYGKQTAAVRPGISILSWLEPRIAAGWFRQATGPRDAQYFLEAKAVPLSTDDHPFGLGLVAGFNLDRLKQFLGDRGAGGAYAQVLASAVPMEDHLYIHSNFGWAYASDKFLADPERPNHRFVWSLQMVAIPVQRLELTVESFGTTFDAPFYQAGVSFQIVPDHLKATLSYGGSIIGHSVPSGFTFGITVDTPPLW